MKRQYTTLDRTECVFDLLEWISQRDERPEEISDSLSILASERRRHVLTIVDEHGEPLALADVADEVAIRESGRPLTELSAQRVARVYTSLYHDHLPRLQDAGLLEYDQNRDLVAPGWD